MALIIKESRGKSGFFDNVRKYSVFILAVVVLIGGLIYLRPTKEVLVEEPEEKVEDPYAKFTAPEKGRKLTEDELKGFEGSDNEENISEDILNKFTAPE